MLDDVLKNMALFIDGRGYAGNVEELTLPKLSLKTEEFRNGGMDAPVDVALGMEKLECDFTLTRFDKHALTVFGVVDGSVIPMTIRGAVMSDDGSLKAVMLNLQGFIRELDFGSWKAGDKATLKCSVSLRYYKLTFNNEVLHEIDIANMTRVIDGVDQLAKQRAALGI